MGKPSSDTIWDNSNGTVSQLHALGLLPDKWTEEEEEGNTLFEHSDAEFRAYRRMFQDVAGTHFCADAYRFEYVLAWRIWRFLVEDISNGSVAFLVEGIIHEWGALHLAFVV